VLLSSENNYSFLLLVRKTLFKQPFLLLKAPYSNLEYVSIIEKSSDINKSGISYSKIDLGPSQGNNTRCDEIPYPRVNIG